jgi:hypothetical protein
MLEALERECNVAIQAGSHPHIVRCHASLVDNLAKEHCRVLLCDPCCGDLAAHLKAHGGTLPVEEVVEIGQELALGLRHLHSLDILCGNVTQYGVLQGCDGKWKLLGDLSAAVELPCSVETWCQLHLSSSASNSPLLLAPEARAMPTAGDQQWPSKAQVTPALDVWMLGALLSGMVDGIDARSIAGARAGNTVLPATEDVLLCPVAARLWMLLHWILATEVVQRPWSRRLVEVIHSLCELWPQDLLIEMPEYARFHCQGMATAGARRLAVAGVGGTSANRSCTAGLPLEVLRQSMADPSDVDQLCENCGLELGEYSCASKDDALDVPSLVPVLCEPPLCMEAPSPEKCLQKRRCNSMRGFNTDVSTDEGSTSGDDSTVAGTTYDDDSVCLNGDSSCEAPIGSASPSQGSRQRRPMALSGEL